MIEGPTERASSLGLGEEAQKLKIQQNLRNEAEYGKKDVCQLKKFQLWVDLNGKKLSLRVEANTEKEVIQEAEEILALEQA